MKKSIRKEIEKNIRQYRKLEESNPWRNVIDAVLTKYQNTEKGRLIEYRYFRNRSEVQICMALHISHNLYYDWINDILQDAALMAAYEKLIEPYGA